MKAYVLITAEIGRSPEIQERLRAEGITQVDQVAGTYDIVVVLEDEDPKRIGAQVINTLQKTDGVLSTVTLMKID